MGYIVEYRNERDHEEVKRLLDKAKRALNDACAMMDESEVNYSERNMRGYRVGYRDDDWDDDMNMRRGRGGRYGY